MQSRGRGANVGVLGPSNPYRYDGICGLQGNSLASNLA
jgi:hypothetical protein